MNYKQMVLLQLLLERAWGEEAFRLYFVFQDEVHGSVCSGEFLNNGAQSADYFIDEKQLYTDFVNFSGLENWSFLQGNPLKETHDRILADTLLHQMTSFLRTQKDALSTYIPDEKLPEILYCFYSDDMMIPAYFTENSTYLPLCIE